MSEIEKLVPPETSSAEKADVAIAVELAQSRDHPVMRALGALSEAADQPPMIAAAAATLGWGLLSENKRLSAAGGRMLASVLLATAMKGAIKVLVSRTRPNLAMEKGHYEMKPFGPNEGPWNSFPSGHTANAVAAARAVSRCYGVQAYAYPLAAAASLVQVPRGAHYPIDVAAGALVGFAAEAAVDRVFDEVGRRLDGEANPGRPQSDRP